ncbi:hypothetical protein H4582DRAFT_1993437 [Lactarius indigo]|nr:hypothetical protein H4582DRAFT_1993437 [Lactarius indigo]
MSNRSYLREAHLQAHVHSHLPMSDRPFACEEFDCDKRFWMVQHLRAHTEVIQFGKKTFRAQPRAQPCRVHSCVPQAS